ncbi:acid protease [Gyrodon lividus]|nr:acid protease [Gyrodon lividus]
MMQCRSLIARDCQVFWVTFDTGSSDLWVVSSGCKDKDCQEIPTYSPSASSTLSLSDKPFRLAYLLGSVQGSVGTETITLGAYQIFSQIFALANGTSGLDLKNNGNSGILGLSFPPTASIQPTWGTSVLDNLFSHLEESHRFFAFNLGRNGTLSDLNTTNSSFTIGELDLSIISNTTTQLTYFPVFQTSASPYDYWKLPIFNITINTLPLPLSRSLVRGAPSPIGVLDTGTTLILGPTVDVEAFWGIVGTRGSARYNTQTKLWEVRCDRAVDVRITLGQGEGTWEYVVHPEDISWAEGGERDGWCMGGVQANDGVNSGDWLLGDVFLRNAYVVHQGATSSNPPMIGLMSLTDPQVSLTDFQNARGSDPAPPPSSLSRSYSNQWNANVGVASVGCALGGFLLGGLVTVCYKVSRRSRKVH